MGHKARGPGFIREDELGSQLPQPRKNGFYFDPSGMVYYNPDGLFIL